MHLGKVASVVGTVWFVSAVGASSSGPKVPTSPGPKVSEAAVQNSDTANLYRVNCQMCHGPNGKALIPDMAFVGRKWKHGTKTSDMVKVITEGVKGTPMISFKSKFTPAQIKALASYVRSFDKKLPPEK
jgi:mono/diheme cytochrome c family protein